MFLSANEPAAGGGSVIKRGKPNFFAFELALVLIAVSAAVFFSCGQAPSLVSDNSKQCLVILHINDFHCHITPTGAGAGSYRGGASRIKTVINSEKAEADSLGCDALFIAAGDVMQGTPQSLFTKGMAEFKAMDAVGLEVMTVGNHEFDYGKERLLQLARGAEFKIIAANILYEGTRKPLFAPYASFFTKGGKKIALVGIANAQTPLLTDEKNVEGLAFADPMETLDSLLPTLAETHDYVLIVSHMGDEEDFALAEKLSKTNTPIPILGVVGGHTHKLITPPKGRGIFVAQAQAHGGIVGKIKIILEGGSSYVEEAREIFVTEKIEKDPQVEIIVEKFVSLAKNSMPQKAGELTKDLALNYDHGGEAGSFELGTMIAEIIRKEGKADVGFINSGAIRAPIEKGDVRYLDIVSALPFPNQILRLEMTGDKLLMILSESLSRLDKEAKLKGGFLQLAGARVYAKDGKIYRVMIGGRPLEVDKTYSVATITFLANGGDGYYMLKKSPSIDMGVTVFEAVVRAFKENPVMPPPGDWKTWNIK